MRDQVVETGLGVALPAAVRPAGAPVVAGRAGPVIETRPRCAGFRGGSGGSGVMGGSGVSGFIRGIIPTEWAPAAV